MSEKAKYLSIYSGEAGAKYEADVLPGRPGGGYGRICWGENMLEPLKSWNVASLLDVGCGYGNFCDAAALFVPEVYGLDIASVATGNVVDNHEITFIDGEAKKIPFGDHAVEWITSFDCLEHCLEDDIDIILAEFNRVASKGFILSISYEPCEMDGMPLHMTVKPEAWWIEKLARYGVVTKEGNAPITRTPYLICRKPVEKTVVCYCSGRIGTRLRSMALADQLARQTGRRLILVWLEGDPLCRSTFPALFDNPIPLISEEQMLALSPCKIYAQIKEVADQSLISGRNCLRKAIQKWGVHALDTIVLDDPEDHVIVFTPGIQPPSSIEINYRLLGDLTPTRALRHRIKKLRAGLNIDKTVMGVHARGTDFGIPMDAYAGQIEEAIHRNAAQRFLACSDDPAYEQALKARFPGQVVVRPKSAWMTKIDPEMPWDPANMEASQAAVQETLTDLYLLASTRFEIYHESSAFSQVGAVLSKIRNTEQERQGVTASDTRPLVKVESDASFHCPGIYYVCPDADIQSAGIRRLYRHVEMLTSSGFNASILHQKAGFRRNDLPNVPIRYMSQIVFNKNDILVIPEGCPTIMDAFKDYSVRRFVIALNWDYVFKVLEPGVDWRTFNIERVISVSSPIAEMISWSMGLPTHVLKSSIDHRLYYFDNTCKQPHLVYIARKGVHAACLQRLLGARNPSFVNNFKWIGLDGLSEREYASQIRQAAVFLNLSLAEGFPTSCLEAMAAGTLVAGYRSMGNDAFLKSEGLEQNCLLSPIGDYTALAYALEPFLSALCSGQMHQWEKLLSNGLQTVSGLTRESEAHALISFWSRICANQIPLKWG